MTTTTTVTLDNPTPFQPFAPRKKTRREAQDPHLDDVEGLGVRMENTTDQGQPEALCY